MIFEHDTEKLIEKILTWSVLFLVCVLWIFLFTRGTERLKSTVPQVIELPSGWSLYQKQLDTRLATRGIMSLHEVATSSYIQANPTGIAYLAESERGEALAFIFVGDNGKSVNHTMHVRTPCKAFQARKVQEEDMEISTTSCTYDFVKQETTMKQSVYLTKGFSPMECLFYTFSAFVILWAVKKYVIRSKYDEPIFDTGNNT